MVTAIPRPSAMLHRAGRLAALLALAGQMLLGMLVPQPPADLTLVALLGDPGAICHAGGDPSHPGHGDPDCPLCPVCATLLHVAPLPVLPPAMPRPRAGAIATATPRAPRVAAATPRLQAAEPRGPPARA
jgi:hypothetical protein